MRPSVKAVAAVLALLAPGLALPGSAAGGPEPPAEDATGALVVLPTTFAARRDAVALWTGSEVLLLGGEGTSAEIILHIDPTTLQVTAGASLPRALVRASGVWTGTAAYLFAGDAAGDEYRGTNTTYRYDPATRTLTELAARLPDMREATSAAWDGTYAYVYGGVGHGIDVLGQKSRFAEEWADIFRFDPATETLTLLPERLPYGLYHTSAFSHNGSTYLLGGPHGAPRAAAILRHTPATGTVETIASGLPRTFTLGPTDVGFDGTHAYLVGGWNGWSYRPTDMITRFSPADGSVAYMTAILPYARGHSALAWTGGSFLVLGGFFGSPIYKPQGDMLRYTPGLDAVSPAQGDLLAHSCRFTSDSVFEGDPTGVAVTLYNDGMAPTAPSTVTLRIDGVPVGTFAVPALDPGRGLSVSSGPTWNATRGWRNIEAEVNPDGATPEYRMDNNRCASRQLVRPYVDVGVTILSIQDVTPAGAVSTSLLWPERSAEVRVCNLDESWTLHVFLQLDAFADVEAPPGPEHLAGDIFYNLAPGTCETRTIPYTLDSTFGTYRVRASVDTFTTDPVPENNVHEVEDSSFADAGTGVVVGRPSRFIELLDDTLCTLPVSVCPLV